MQINRERLVNTLIELIQIDSPSGQEAEIGAELARRLRALAMDVTVDAADNVLARWEADGPYMLLSAHMDTVPGVGIKPVVADGVIRSDGTTILGSDDKSGIAVILEVLTLLHENGRHPALEVAFSVSEEIGLLGAKAIDPAWPCAREALVFDSGGPLHAIAYGAPGSDKITAIIHGKAAHAGANPEDGINAIQIAAQAIAKMSLGRIDEVTTANIGLIEGGQAVNIVPDRVQIRGETRSHDEAQLAAQTGAICTALERAVAAHPGARLELDVERTYRSYRLPPETPLLRRIVQTLAEMGEPEPVWRLVGGGSDANVFNAHGLTAVPISTGMSSVHTNNEFIAIDDMAKSAEFLFKMVLPTFPEVFNFREGQLGRIIGHA